MKNGDKILGVSMCLNFCREQFGHFVQIGMTNLHGTWYIGSLDRGANYANLHLICIFTEEKLYLHCFL